MELVALNWWSMLRLVQLLVLVQAALHACSQLWVSLPSTHVLCLQLDASCRGLLVQSTAGGWLCVLGMGGELGGVQQLSGCQRLLLCINHCTAVCMDSSNKVADYVISAHGRQDTSFWRAQHTAGFVRQT